MLADIVVYDLENLKVKPMKTVRDLPDGDWLSLHHVNGQITFQEPPAYENDKPERKRWSARA